jgi:hypothetical protein
LLSISGGLRKNSEGVIPPVDRPTAHFAFYRAKRKQKSSQLVAQIVRICPNLRAGFDGTGT